MIKNFKPKRKGLKITGIVLASALLLGGATAGVMYWNLNQRIHNKAVDIGITPVQKPTMSQPAITDNTPKVAEFNGAFNLLLVGSDDGNGDPAYGFRDHALNDVNILLHVSADHRKATAISVPRDMFVTVPECTDATTGAVQPAVMGVKINTTLERGGLKCAVDAFRQLTGETIDYAAMLQFHGVIALSNVVGGVPVCTTSDINDPDSGLNITAGNHSISGDQALAFLRTRHGVGDGSDLARISNQQSFLSSLMRTLKSKDTLSDPKKVYEMANVVADNMTLSTNLASIPTIASLAYSLKDIPLNSISFLQYPTAYADEYGESGVVAKKAAADEMIEAVFSDKDISITGGTAPGSIGAYDETKTMPTTVPTASPTATIPDTTTPTVAPTAIPTTTETATATKPVKLPTDVTGMTASQNTCSRGYGDY